MDVFGFPLEEWRDFADPFHKIIYTRVDDPDIHKVVAGLDLFYQRVDEEVAKRRVEPRDDVLGYMANGTIDGAPLDGETIRQLSFNILAGGVDTTTALTSNTLIWLARNPDQRQRLIDDQRLLRSPARSSSAIIPRSMRWPAPPRRTSISTAGRLPRANA